jgi:RNA recognition motif-containing protein
MLSNVFKMKYHSCQMAKVVKDKRTGKTRGYGFISFKEPKDFLNALK